MDAESGKLTRRIMLAVYLGLGLLIGCLLAFAPQPGELWKRITVLPLAVAVSAAIWWTHWKMGAWIASFWKRRD